MSRGAIADFVGRAAELASLASAFDEAVAAHPSVIWIEGPAGSGKTTLLREALAGLPEEFVTIRAQADEVANDVAYELARQLGSDTAEGAFFAGQALLGTWARSQERGPVVVVVEDLHWADPASSQAILSAVRHLDQDRIVVIITSRPGPDEGWERFRRDDGRCKELILRAFDANEVADLAAARGIELSPRQAIRLTEHTGGHPLWVHTLLVELSPAELRSPGELPAPRSLASAVTARLSEVSTSGRALAAALSVINQRVALAVVGRVAGIAQPLEGFETLLAAGLVRWDSREPGSPVEFVHPLYRLAVYEDLPPTRRRDLHHSAAQVLTPAAVLAHRVAATDGTNDALADELEASAASEKMVGANATAGRNLLWASSLSGSTERSERLLVEAGLALLDAGQSPRAAMLRTQLEACRESATRSLVLGLIDWELGDVSSAERWFGDATEGDGGERSGLIAARAWAQLAEIHVFQGRAQGAVDAARRALALGERDIHAERLGWIHQSVGEAMMYGGPAGLDLLSQRLPADPEQIPGSEVDLLVTRATLAYYSAQPMSALADLQVVLGLIRRGSVPVQLARCHFLMASLLTNRGDWDEALIHARTALAVASDDQLVWVLSQCHAALGTLLAYRGEWEGAEHHVARASDIAFSHESLEAMGTARLARAALARARNEPDRVIDELGPLASFAPALSALHFWPSLIHALIETNRIDEAQEQSTRLSRAAEERRLNLDNRLLLIRARLAAATGQPEMAVGLFDEARERFGPEDSFLDRVLLHQSYGRLFHSRGDRRRGIDELRIAWEMLTGVGARPLMAQVEADLAASGLPSAPKSVSRSTLDLTDRERDVAVLVAQGMSNPEVADHLYVSRKAIEFHLGNIYGKLGITSRRELRSKQFSF